MAYPFYQGYPAYNQYYQQMQNMQQLNQPQQNLQTNPQIQNGGFVMVKDITEAMNYPVAPGNSVTFKNENQPYIYTKTLGFSQLDQPIFETFRLVKEERQIQNNSRIDNEEPELKEVEYLSASYGEEINAEISELKNELDKLKAELNELKVELGDCDKAEVVLA